MNAPSRCSALISDHSPGRACPWAERELPSNRPREFTRLVKGEGAPQSDVPVQHASFTADVKSCRRLILQTAPLLPLLVSGRTFSKGIVSSSVRPSRLKAPRTRAAPVEWGRSSHNVVFPASVGHILPFVLACEQYGRDS